MIDEGNENEMFLPEIASSHRQPRKERRVNAEQQALVAARELAQPWTKYPLGSPERARVIDEHIEAHRPLVLESIRPTGSKAEQDSWCQIQPKRKGACSA